MKTPAIVYIDRLTGRRELEKVYGRQALELLYGDHWISRFIRPALLPFLTKWPFFSAFYGYLQKKTGKRTENFTLYQKILCQS